MHGAKEEGTGMLPRKHAWIHVFERACRREANLPAGFLFMTPGESRTRHEKSGRNTGKKKQRYRHVHFSDNLLPISFAHPLKVEFFPSENLHHREDRKDHDNGGNHNHARQTTMITRYQRRPSKETNPSKKPATNTKRHDRHESFTCQNHRSLA